MASTTKRKWLEEGFALLAEIGANALIIDTLASRLGVTKGSFYHHFKHFQDYKEQLMAFFEKQRTLQIIESADQYQSPHDRLEVIMQATMNHPNQAEVAIRAWALQDPFVKGYLQRIDRRRLAYHAEVLFQICHDRERANRLSQVFYSMFVGSQHILPPIQGQELEAFYHEIGKIADLLFAPSQTELEQKES